jgi:multiple sugar transport system permease protein
MSAPAVLERDAIAVPAVRPARFYISKNDAWGAAMLAPYLVVFCLFVFYPIAYGLWLARHPQTYVELFDDPIFLRTVINTIVFLGVAINVKMLLALLLSGYFIQARWWIRILGLIFILPWALPSIPTILSIRFMLNPEWGIINSTIFRLTFKDGPNWLNDPTLALSLAMVTHIWKALPFWTLILIAGRLAISHDLYEASSIDGANSWQKFRFVTWPSMRTLYLTCTLLSTIWTLGDFNSVYLLTGGGPADLTHVLATLGIRYLRLDQVDHYMAAVVCALPAMAPLVYFMMTRLSRDPAKEASK